MTAQGRDRPCLLDLTMSGPRELLRRINANDERCLSALMAPTPEFGNAGLLGDEALDRRVRGLVRLAALLVVDAPTASLRWAVELALANGVSDAAVARTFLSTARAAGSAQFVSAAPKVGFALGFDMDVEPEHKPQAASRQSPLGDPKCRAIPPAQPDRPPRNVTRRRACGRWREPAS